MAWGLRERLSRMAVGFFLFFSNEAERHFDLLIRPGRSIHLNGHVPPLVMQTPQHVMGPECAWHCSSNIAIWLSFKKNSEPPQTSPFRFQKIRASCFERRCFHEIPNKDRLFLSYHLHWPSINVTVAYVNITVFALLVETAYVRKTFVVV